MSLTQPSWSNHQSMTRTVGDFLPIRNRVLLSLCSLDNRPVVTAAVTSSDVGCKKKSAVFD